MISVPKYDQLNLGKIANEIEMKLKKKNNTYSKDERKVYKMAYKLWRFVISDAREVLGAFNLNDPFTYNVKSLVENYSNFSNLIKYKNDYRHVLKVLYLTEDIGAVEHRDGYNAFGFSVSDNVNELLSKRKCHYDKISAWKIKKLVIVSDSDSDSDNESTKKYLVPINKRLRHFVRDLPEDNVIEGSKFMALYDIANNFGHLNLRFMKKANTETRIINDELNDICEYILLQSTIDLMSIFKMDSNVKNFKGKLRDLKRKRLDLENKDKNVLVRKEAFSL